MSRAQSVVLHLSDVHLTIGPPAQQAILLACLRGAIEHELAHRRAGADLVVVTGDVFDSAHFAPKAVAHTFASFCAEIRRAVGPGIPILVQPGNHDRRRFGIFGPHDASLFAELARSAGHRVFVHGNAAPFHAELVPQAVHGLPLYLVTYDTTVLPRGLVSAGGVIRQEELLQIAAEIEAVEAEAGPRAHPGSAGGSGVAGGDGDDTWPLVVLMHHHLVPTPCTDMDRIAFPKLPGFVRWSLEEGLSHLVAHGDREELTMTALGAGTALSTLHTLGRAVLVLHGHKHHPTVRLLRGVGERDGDVLLGSAGSAGSVQQWRQAEIPREARVWPSFNVVTMRGAELEIVSVSFSHQKPEKPPRRSTLIRAVRRGARWDPVQAPADPPGPGDLPIALNESVVRLSPTFGDRGLWDFECRRTVHGAGGATPGHHLEVVHGLPKGTVTVLGGDLAARPLPAQVRVPRHGTVAFRVERAACRTAAAGREHQGADAAHAWVGLFVRHGSARARLVLEGLSASRRRPFGSVTDLGTGEERARHLERQGKTLLLEERSCPPRTLLRIYWALED
jgi:3',5'-cyclic AMP phosphodiesterase CpdA